jgi:hypothetical protein
MGSTVRGSTNFVSDSGSRDVVVGAAASLVECWSAANWSAEYLRKRRRVGKLFFKDID